jgi:hypothetical protein
VTVVINELEVEPAEPQPSPPAAAPAGGGQPAPARLARDVERLLEVRATRAARLAAW